MLIELLAIISPVALLVWAFHLQRKKQEMADAMTAAQESHHKFRSNLPVSLLRIDADGKAVWANEHLVHTLHYSSSDALIQHACDDQWHVSPAKDADANAAQQQITLRQHNGGMRQFSMLPQRGENGSPFIDLILVDQTEAERTRQKLHAASSYLAAILDTSNELFCQLNPDGSIRLASPRFTELLGYSEDGIKSGRFDDLVHPQDKQNFAALLVKLQSEPRTNFSRLQLQMSNGEWHLFQGSAKTLPPIEPNGNSIFHFCLRDIDQLSRLRRARHNAESRYYTLLRELPDIILQLDANNQVNLASQGIKATSGYSTEAAAQEDFVKRLVDPACLTHFFQGVAQARQGKRALLNLTIRSIGSEKKRMRMHFFAVPESMEVFVVMQDISREGELRNQLAHSQKLETIGTLTRGLAHEFNNYLTGIMGNVAFAAEEITSLGGQIRVLQALQDASNSAELCAELTHCLLTFSRNEKPSQEPTELNGLIQPALLLLRRTIPNSITIKTTYANDPGVVMLDHGQFQKMLLNLFLNSQTAIEQRGSQPNVKDIIVVKTEEVEVSTEQIAGHVDAQPGKYMRLTVSDNGIGIAQEHLQNIFDPFFTTKDVGASGLGLSTVYGILKGHQGWVEVDSRPRAGTSFKLYFPLIGQIAKTVETAEVVGGNETILIVDDEEGVRSFATKALQKWGYYTLQAADGEEALRIYQENQTSIDLLLVDLTMPELDGRGLLRAVRKLRTDAKAILSSGYNDNDYAISPELDSATAFLQKPYIPRDLARMVREILDSKN